MADIILQLGGSIPESILFGTTVLYMITMNTAFGVFAIFILEMVLSHKLISWMFEGSVGPDTPTKPIGCYAGYKLPRRVIDRMVAHHEYPSYGFFSITAIATYLGLSTHEFSDIMKNMGPQWMGRTTMAYLFIICVMILILVMRLSLCEKPIELFYACVFGILCGGIFFKINKVFFNIEALNFLGLPTIDRKTKEGDAIYVCAKDIATS